MVKSDYAYKVEDEFLIIKDLNLGRMSVTNDIENVLNEIGKVIILDLYKIIYEDSDGMFDAVLTYQNEFTDYYILGVWSKEEAKEKFTEYYNSVIKADTKKEKILHLTIRNCGDCPYSEYDTHYDLTSNSGWNCNKGLGRIVSDVDGEMTDISQIAIPDNCPLPNK